MSDQITIRNGTTTDSYQVFLVFERAVGDLMERMGTSRETSIADPESLERMWNQRKSLFEHLAENATEFWVAERSDEILGYSRSILRDDVLELTELMIVPEAQSLGFGRELIERAFTKQKADHKTIIATTDMRAQKLYLKNGVFPRFAIYYFGREPEPVEFSAEIEIKKNNASPKILEAIGEIDKTIIGHRRDTEHQWFAKSRQGFLYYRARKLIGYGYIGVESGPFALLDVNDYPPVLAHAETQAAAAGNKHFGIEIPTSNLAAMEYLLTRGFEPGNFAAIYMSNQPLGQFENYVFTSPPLFV